MSDNTKTHRRKKQPVFLGLTVLSLVPTFLSAGILKQGIETSNVYRADKDGKTMEIRTERYNDFLGLCVSEDNALQAKKQIEAGAEEIRTLTVPKSDAIQDCITTKANNAYKVAIANAEQDKAFGTLMLVVGCCVSGMTLSLGLGFGAPKRPKPAPEPEQLQP